VCISLLKLKGKDVGIEYTRDQCELKAPKCEVFDRWDFHDFYTIKTFWVGDFEAKI
jgi:hypothetical protein